MSFPPLFYRSGSILVPLNSQIRRPAVSAGPTDPSSPRTARRKGFSEHHNLSLYSGQACWNNRLEEALHAWAETEPCVVDVQIVNLAISYKVEGKTRRARLPLKVESQSGAIAYWDCVSIDGGNSLGLDAKRAFAEAANAGYRLMSWKFFKEHRSEVHGRLQLQNILHSGQAIRTTDIESQAMLRLAGGPCSIAELTASLHTAELVMQVAVARLWCAGKVHLPIAESPLNMRWLVSQRRAYEA